MAAQNSYIAAMVGVNTVGICNIQIVENTNSVNKHIIASGRMKSPKRSVDNRKLLKCNMIAFFNINNGRTRVKITRYIVLVLALNKSVTVCVNSTLTAYCTIISLISINKHKTRFTRYRIADKCGFRVVNQFVGTNISVNIACSLEPCTLLDMQVNICLELD